MAAAHVRNQHRYSARILIGAIVVAAGMVHGSRYHDDATRKWISGTLTSIADPIMQGFVSAPPDWNLGGNALTSVNVNITYNSSANNVDGTGLMREIAFSGCIETSINGIRVPSLSGQFDSSNSDNRYGRFLAQPFHDPDASVHEANDVVELNVKLADNYVSAVLEPVPLGSFWGAPSPLVTPLVGLGVTNITLYHLSGFDLYAVTATHDSNAIFSEFGTQVESADDVCHETNSPTTLPTNLPSEAPSSSQPSPFPSDSPTESPTISLPTTFPTQLPTAFPSITPSSGAPSAVPTVLPSLSPTFNPTRSPSSLPTAFPSTSRPTTRPTTSAPTEEPTQLPSLPPSVSPTDLESQQVQSNSQELTREISSDRYTPLWLQLTIPCAIVAVSGLLIVYAMRNKVRKERGIHTLYSNGSSSKQAPIVNPPAELKLFMTPGMLRHYYPTSGDQPVGELPSPRSSA